MEEILYFQISISKYFVKGRYKLKNQQEKINHEVKQD